MSSAIAATESEKPTKVLLVANDGIVIPVDSRSPPFTSSPPLPLTPPPLPVSTVLLLGEGSPVRTAIDNFGEAARSADGQSFQVEVPKLDSALLQTAINWVEAHRSTPTAGESAYAWPVDEITNERGHVKLSEGDKAMLEKKGLDYYVPLLDAAHYLGIESLRWATSQCIAEQLKNKNPDEMRLFLNEPDDLSPDEKEAIRREDVWANY
jgi:Skp1 family, dimerisation domain